MTPEQTMYHMLMLKLGRTEEYDRELDRLLEEQDPLSPLVLELAFCMSDRRETISVLHNFLLDHPADQQILGFLRNQIGSAEMEAGNIPAAAAYFVRPPVCGRHPLSHHTRRVTGLSPSRASSSAHTSTCRSGCWPLA